MRLISLTSNKNSFRTVRFNETGLSFIIAKQKNPGESDKGKTYNGVGKSLLVAIIHFCLGAKKKYYASFEDKLPGWTFTLNFVIGQNKYTATRSTKDQNKIVLNDEELSELKFNDKMQELCFDLPPDMQFLSFRSLLPFFLRPKRDSYVDCDKPTKAGSEYQTQVNNAFLLGLDVHLSQNKYKLRKEQERIRKLTENIKKDNLMKEFFSGYKDPTLALQDLNEKIGKLEKDLINFKVAEDYYDIRADADKIERQLAELQNEITLIQNQVNNIEQSLKISPDLGRENIENAYNEAHIFFAEKVVKTLDQLESFYSQLAKSRKLRLTQQKQILTRSLDIKTREKKKLEAEFDGKLQYLGAHQALDLFVKVNNQLSSLKSNRDGLIKYSKLIEQYHTSSLTIKEELVLSTKQVDQYLKETRELIESYRDFFRKLAKRFYPEAASGITIYNNEGENQIRFDIDAKIESDASDGINHVKIFCYDLTLLFKGFGHFIHFAFHDSRIFDGIDERQKTELFRIAYEMFNETDYQYIATVNQNQLEEIKKLLSEDEYKKIVTDNTVLTLTDDSDVEKLLGLKVDLTYE